MMPGIIQSGKLAIYTVFTLVVVFFLIGVVNSHNQKVAREAIDQYQRRDTQEKIEHNNEKIKETNLRSITEEDALMFLRKIR